VTSDRSRRHRRSVRLPGYDYSQPGAYFITICTHRGECLFADPVLRRVVETMWLGMPRHFPRLSLDAWVLMPNHFHGVPILSDVHVVGAMHSQEGLSQRQASHQAERPSMTPDSGRNASPLRSPPGAIPGSVGAIIGNFKSVTARRVNQIRRTPGALVWQRNYYVHIIRTARALTAIREYIAGNPARWRLDKYNALADGTDPLAAQLWHLLQEEAF
jgi:REP-associated tyrosine transposase